MMVLYSVGSYQILGLISSPTGSQILTKKIYNLAHNAYNAF